MRIGNGYDLHLLTEGRKLILGGVHIPFSKGLYGYSDADVLAHAISDALLGAAALGDIGQHFPDTDPLYEGADSLELLAQVVSLLAAQGHSIINIDSIVIAQAPKIEPYCLQIREKIAQACGISVEQINVKATTEEGLGSTGEGKAIAAQAVALIS